MDLRLYLRDGGRCEDCDLRGALADSGNPKVDKWTGTSLTWGCEACGGSGILSQVVVVPAAEAAKILTDKQLFVLERRLGDHRYSLREIAKSMGISHKAVHKLELAGLKRLRGVHA